MGNPILVGRDISWTDTYSKARVAVISEPLAQEHWKGVGVALGIGAAIRLTRLMSALLSGISAVDPVTFGAVAMVLGAVALLASYLPARRASSVNPVEALRWE